MSTAVESGRIGPRSRHWHFSRAVLDYPSDGVARRACSFEEDRDDHSCVRLALDANRSYPVSMAASRSASLALAMFVFAACQRSAPNASPLVSEITNFQWILRSLNGNPAGMGAGGREVTLRFSPAGEVSGFAGCNRFGATYVAQGDSLRLGPIRSTRMACDAGMSLERDFLLALDTVRGYRVNDRHLELLGLNGTIAEFDRR